ncbi:hypothetical protein F5883DRAFT_361506, partial [Diaporthe sp. PMI_573]
SEEWRHPWRARCHQGYEQPLLRIWDEHSGSQPKNHSMLSRAPDMRLDTYQKRKSSLANHLDYREWIAGPYISFTTSPAAIEDHVRRRRGKDRGSQKLTVVDPKQRIANGLPVLDVLTEMENYEILDPYGLGNHYYINEHVCLWEVTEAEIVGHWEWDDLEQNENWYENIVMPAFKE